MKIGIFGTGLMGSAMAIKLLENDYEVMAYNRTITKLLPLQEQGIKISNAPKEVIYKTDILILMLTNASAIIEVLNLRDHEINLQDKIFIQMGTIEPEESQEISKMIKKKGGNYLEAPVLGSIPEVQNGTLLVMVGGDQLLFQEHYNLLKVFSLEPQLIGEIGTASALKLALNQLIASLTNAFGLSLALMEKEGINIEQFMKILRQSALYAPTFDKKLHRMLEGNFANPNFPTKHLLKDTELFLNYGEKMGLNIVSLKGLKQVIENAINLGYGDADYSAIYQAIKEI